MPIYPRGYVYGGIFADCLRAQGPISPRGIQGLVVPEVHLGAFAAAHADGVLVIDVRERCEYVAGHGCTSDL